MSEFPMDAAAREQLSSRLLSNGAISAHLRASLPAGVISFLEPPPSGGYPADISTMLGPRAHGPRTLLSQRWLRALDASSCAVLLTQNDTFGSSWRYGAERPLGMLDPGADLIVAPLIFFLEPDGDAIADSIFEWVDAYGPTLLLARPPQRLVAEGTHVPTSDELREIVASATEAYVPIFNGDSYAVWTPER